MKTNIYKALAAAALFGSAALPLAASAQTYGYGPSSVINAWTAGIPLVTYGFGNAYGAPAAAYYGYQDNYYGGYRQGPSAGYLNWAPQNYQTQPYYGGYTQAYMPNYYGGPVQQNYYGYGQQQYGYGRYY